MPTSFYDVVVLGTQLEPLVCAALLAREGLRVLVLGQGASEPSYTLDGVTVEPYGLTLTGTQSPVIQHTLELLALRQDVRHRTAARTQVLQLLLPEHRIDVFPETDRWLEEVQRELPGVRRQAADISRTLREVAAELDLLVSRGLTWPPETFIERQQFAFTASAQRYDRQGQGWTSWNQLAPQHPLRSAFEAVLPHVSGLLPAQHSDATRGRLHGQASPKSPGDGLGFETPCSLEFAPGAVTSERGIAPPRFNTGVATDTASAWLGRTRRSAARRSHTERPSTSFRRS